MKSSNILLCALLWTGIACTSCTPKNEADDAPQNIVYGIVADDYRLETGEVAEGETMSKLLGTFGITPATVDRLDRASKAIFPLRRTKKSAVINSSLWGAIMEQNLPYALAAEMEDVYQWTIDFFGIQKGDSFTVIYDERFIDDTVSVGIGRIWGARFTQNGKDYYAIPFHQGGKVRYWEADGRSLRKQLLKAPLKYTRISSRFSYARKHPIYKVYRPHTGVDYAAPKGTPVRAVADGTVIFKGWGGGGGNTLKIKHAGNLQTGYLHLSRYAKGIATGKRVVQGQLIGYVGSTGASTGPHLDFRIWKNGKPIDPLKIPQEPAEPIAKAHRAEFDFVRDRIMAELNGDVADDMRITRLDSLELIGFGAVPAGSETTTQTETAKSTKKAETTTR